MQTAPKAQVPPTGPVTVSRSLGASPATAGTQRPGQPTRPGPRKRRGNDRSSLLTSKRVFGAQDCRLCTKSPAWRVTPTRWPVAPCKHGSRPFQCADQPGPREDTTATTSCQRTPRKSRRTRPRSGMEAAPQTTSEHSCSLKTRHPTTPGESSRRATCQSTQSRGGWPARRLTLSTSRS